MLVDAITHSTTHTMDPTPGNSPLHCCVKSYPRGQRAWVTAI